MKKIGKYLFLLVICLVPVMVDAKAEFTLEKEFLYEIFLYDEDGKIYFINTHSSGPNDPESLHVFDNNNSLIESNSLFLDSEIIKEQYSHRPFLEYKKYSLFISDGERLYKYGDNLYKVNYESELIEYFNLDDETVGGVYFDDDLNFTKTVLGKKYDVYDYYKKAKFTVYDIEEFDNHYTVIGYDENYKFFIAVVDKDLNIILNFEYDDYFKYRPVIYIKDDLIYLKKDNKNIDIYKLDGTKIQTLTIWHKLIDEYDNDGSCYYLDFDSIHIVNNKLYLSYYPSGFDCERRLNITDANDFAKVAMVRNDIFTVKYSLDYDIDVVNSSNGEFTYETKVDEDGKSYVELKITPKDGYSVKEIIVTDVNGNRIEVINNKFYKPMNDVKIEVKYVNGEYLPIPDTFLGKSFTVIIIGLILVGLGFYTINYAKGESKVDI